MKSEWDFAVDQDTTVNMDKYSYKRTEGAGTKLGRRSSSSGGQAATATPPVHGPMRRGCGIKS